MSIRQRGKDTWLIEISLGFDSEGKRRRHIETFHGNITEAKKKEIQIKADFMRGTMVLTPKITLKEFSDKWIEEYAEPMLAPKTTYEYKKQLKRLNESLGHLKLDQIKHLNIMEFYNKLRKPGSSVKKERLSENTILHYHVLITRMLNMAVKWGLLANNPATRVERPRVGKSKASKYYDLPQTKKLLQCLKEQPLRYQLLIMLGISTGARRGEILGLEWSDVDFNENTININKASQYITGQGVFTKGTKTETSNRIVTVSDEVMELMKHYKKEQNEERLKLGDLWKNSNRLFTTADGAPMHPDTASGWFSKFLKKNNLPKIPFHGLRHTSATLLIDQGLHAKVISSRLGHSNISTTMDIYGHALRTADKEAADKLNKLFVDNNKETKIS